MRLFINLDQCLLTGDIKDYYNVAQGKTSIPGLDDGEELTLTDVRMSYIYPIKWPNWC